MTVELNRLPDDLPWERVKRRIGEKISELQAETRTQANTDERMRVARDLMGVFTADELSEAAGVSHNTAQYKIEYWLALGEIEAGGSNRNGAVVYGVVDEQQ
jgi:Fic family protein